MSTSSRRTNTLAVVSFAAALLGWTMLPFIGSVVGIITGHMARAEIRRNGEEGDTFAVLGLVLAWAQVLLLLLSVVLVLLVFGSLAGLLSAVGFTV